MARRAAPTFRRWQLGKQLRRLRDIAGRSMKEAAAELDTSVATISNMERGIHGVRKNDLAKLLECYDVPDVLRPALEDLRRTGGQRGWLRKYGPALPDWFLLYVEAETDAAKVRHVELELIPGLLQTEDYARAVHRAARHVSSPELADRSVAARIERQRRLTDTPPLEVWAILSEAAIRRVVGGPRVMAAQLRHVLAVAELPTVTIQILPFSAGPHASMAGTFSILDFAEYPPIVSIEYPAGGLTLEEDEEISRYTLMFDDLRDASLSTHGSLALVAEVARQLADHGRDSTRES